VPCSTPGPRYGKWSPLAAQADPGGNQSRVHGPGGIWLQRPRLVVAYCSATQTTTSVQGRFLDASGSLTNYNPFRGAVLRRLAARARRQTISAFEPLILLRAPLNGPHQFWM